MTLLEYRSMNENERYVLWLAKSVMVAEQEDEFAYNILYQLDGFYIEMKFFKSASQNVLIRAFSDSKYLAPYLPSIDISGIC